MQMLALADLVRVDRDCMVSLSLESDPIGPKAEVEFDFQHQASTCHLYWSSSIDGVVGQNGWVQPLRLGILQYRSTKDCIAMVKDKLVLAGVMVLPSANPGPATECYIMPCSICSVCSKDLMLCSTLWCSVAGQVCYVVLCSGGFKA